MDFYTRYTKDIFTTLLDLDWTWVILLTAIVYIGHWVIFGVFYWAFAISRDDYIKIWNGTDGEPCVANVYDYASAFLFSMESESTIGTTSSWSVIFHFESQCPNLFLDRVWTSWNKHCMPTSGSVFDNSMCNISNFWYLGNWNVLYEIGTTRCPEKHDPICEKCSNMHKRWEKVKIIIKKLKFVHFIYFCALYYFRCLLVRVANLRKSLLLCVSVRAHMITLRSKLLLHCFTAYRLPAIANHYKK